MVEVIHRVALEPDTEGGYGPHAQVVAHCSLCDFSANYPNYLIAAEILAYRDVGEHLRQTHYLQERYDRLVGKAVMTDEPPPAEPELLYGAYCKICGRFFLTRFWHRLIRGHWPEALFYTQEPDR